MPKIESDRIVFLPEDRQIVMEQSTGITASTYTNIFNGAITSGDTTKYFKFLEEIAEKDPDILHSISTRTSYITSKEWSIEGDSEQDAAAVEEAIRNITGDPAQGLLSISSLIDALLGSAYLVGLSINEVVTDDEKILGFSHIPAHFLTFNETVHYPKLWTQEKPTGVEINQEKFISHFLKEGADPVRGWLGNCISWLYVLKRTAMDSRLQFQRKYGKGFLLINMPGDKDSYEKAWETAEELIENYSNTDGAVFPANVDVDFKESGAMDGEYFFTTEEAFKASIVKVILGQDSTSSAEDSNRSTADVHMEVLEQRILDDAASIENTFNTQLIPMVKEVIGISEASKCEFKFVVSELEETMDEDLDGEEAVEEEDQMVEVPDDSSREERSTSE